MAVNTAWRESPGGYGQGRLSGNALPLPQKLFGRPVLACMALACAWMLWTHLAGTGTDQAEEARPGPPAGSIAYARAYTKLSAALNAYARRATASNGYLALFDSRWLGAAPGTFTGSFALRTEGEPPGPADQSTPAKPQAAASTLSRAGQIVHSATAAARQLLTPPLRTASLRDDSRADQTAPDGNADKPTIFEKLFGRPAPLTLAYASTDDGGLTGRRNLAAGQYGPQTAVYDISAHTVYLPDGTRLEAHSGLGSRIDDPSHADERMRGSTPPNIYDLQMREAPFHGVQALRLIPVDERKVFGRAGLLAHTYMLGPNGQSYGCVSFRNYNAFLQAYLKREIKRLVVVARLD
jgi:type VI secretion system (T6SS) effector TldE1-like protein